MKNENNKNKKLLVFRHVVFFVSYFFFLVILASCGKKGEPTLKSYEKPDPPSKLKAIHRESGIILSWDFPKNKEKTIRGCYLMKSMAPYIPLIPSSSRGDGNRSKEGGGEVEKIFLKNTERSYSDKEFMIGSKYWYKIISQNLKGVLSIDSNIVAIEPKEPPPAPGGLLFKVEYGSLTLTWEDEGDGIFYNVYKSDKKGVYSLSPINTEPIKGTSFKDSFDIRKTVFYTVRGMRGGVVRDEGPPSKEIEVNPSNFVPSSPEGLQAIATEEGVQLIWKESPETWVKGYRVYRRIDKEEGFVFIGETPVPAYFDREKPATKRNYRVTALGPSKEGIAAEIRDVVLVPYR
ncbi:MAG: hypothetical protein A2Y81_11580 [Nitrospirae bacterium RBG_13_43_8]|nr:MAG: hypothetical protein A2Y81_11580 [Nitrospirae bacterium RBG_13_43_8]